MSDIEYIDFSNKVCDLVDISGGVQTKEIHYFRNYFSKSPETLSEMIDTIINKDDLFDWRLMPLAAMAFHMFGEDGEYNLKFISGDGRFEVVYNKHGEKLTVDNDPLNMGTFNYANQSESSVKHYQYDIEPYLKWWNAVNANVTKETITNNYAKNEEVLKRYDTYYELILRAQ
jgi:hypothetical protein